MKRLAVSIGGFLAVMCLGAMPAAAQRIQGRSATANGSEHIPAAAMSRGDATKPGSKTPAELLTENKRLSDKLSRILKQQNPPVTDLQAAAQGFRVLAQFVVAVYISHDLGIPFDQLKAQAQTTGSYSKAIHTLRPDADDKAELRKAAMQAVEDIRQSQRRS